MKQKLLKLLVCPNDSHELNLEVEKSSGEEIESGSLSCPQCGKRYSIKRRVPRFVTSDAYASNFSLEWTKHNITQLDSKNGTKQSYRTFTRRTGFSQNNLNGKLVLDVGCGTGRFMEIARNFGAEVVGVDLSFAVDSAQANFSNDPKIHIIQADIFNLPFRVETFDAIYSIGVLHHTRDTRSAFEKILHCLKPGGRIAIWVYNHWGFYNTVSDFYRCFTTRLPEALLYRLCVWLVPPIYFFHKRGKIWRYIIPLPISYNTDKAWRILDTFDWYSPKYQWKHNVGEVKKWFTDNGLENISSHEVPVSVSGQKK